MLPLDSSVEAEYADGYILSETEHKDVSPYNNTENILRAIINKDPEKEHGRMVRFSAFYNNARYDVDWTSLPDSARPIRFKYHERKATASGVWLEEARVVRLDFGYQYNTEDGKNVQEVLDITKENTNGR